MAADRKGLTWIFTFGQYKGQTLERVIENNPQYVLWAVQNIDWFDIDGDALTWLSESYQFKTGEKLKIGE